MAQLMNTPKGYIRDPALAVAIGKCLVYRADPSSLLAQQAHPQICDFCAYDKDRLNERLEEFNAWAGLTPPKVFDPYEPPPPIQPAVEAFQRLPDEEQQALVRTLQGYDEPKMAQRERAPRTEQHETDPSTVPVGPGAGTTQEEPTDPS